MDSTVALVTGGSRGLGRSISTRLAKSGVGVVLTYRTDEGAAQTVVDEITNMGARAVKMRLDVTDFDAYDTFVKALGGVLQGAFDQSHLDYLVNNAGVATFAPFTKADPVDFDQMFAVNVKAPYFLTKALLDTLSNNSGCSTCQRP
jgi:NAD(P)-dependent dehydrogenase (short-subunit alcohol dehydrogenase family)